MRDSSADSIRELLRSVRLRATAARIAVLGVVERAAAPLTHAGVCEALGGSWDRATVYRNLIDLTNAGLLRKRDLGDHLWRFERVRADAAHHEAEHPHFLCTSCGGVSCLPEIQVVGPDGAVPAALAGASVQITGTCEACS